MPVINAATPARVVLAATAWGEARGGGLSGMTDVLSVVMNRAARGWAASPAGVCLARLQFSCLNPGSSSAAEIAAVALTEPSFALALGLADRALAGRLGDMTGGADSYFATSIAAPYWAHPPAVHTVTRWLHSFWRVRPAGTPAPAAMSADELNAAELLALGISP